MGFKYIKDDNRRSLMEKPHVVHQRFCFLKKYMENEEMGPNKKQLVFLDETWIYQNGSVRKSWQDDDPRSVKKVTGDGNRYIILHAGTEQGFIDGASLLFRSGKSSGDYHGEMNATVFEKWLKEDLLPNLEEPSMIILDNASYHSRQAIKVPTQSSTKGEMRNWLQKKHVQFSETATKLELYDLIKPFNCSKTLVVDQMIEEAGHQVLRLPPYHCQFNAIEMVWSQAKRYYDKQILKNKDVLAVWRQALSNVSPEQWAKYVQHTHKLIKSAWDELKVTQMQKPLIIHLGEQDSSSESQISDEEVA